MTNKRKLEITGITILFATILFNSIYLVNKHTKKTNQEDKNFIILKSGQFDILDNQNVIVGNIIIQNKDSVFIENICGSKYTNNFLDEEYTLDSIEYSNLDLQLGNYNYESYYYHDTGHSILMIIKLSNQHRIYLKNLSKKDKRNLFLLSEISYEEYFTILHSSISIETYILSDIPISYYSCYFLQ